MVAESKQMKAQLSKVGPDLLEILLIVGQLVLPLGLTWLFLQAIGWYDALLCDGLMLNGPNKFGLVFCIAPLAFAIFFSASLVLQLLWRRVFKGNLHRVFPAYLASVGTLFIVVTALYILTAVDPTIMCLDKRRLYGPY
jgi:hypothetical protein